MVNACLSSWPSRVLCAVVMVDGVTKVSIRTVDEAAEAATRQRRKEIKAEKKAKREAKTEREMVRCCFLTVMIDSSSQKGLVCFLLGFCICVLCAPFCMYFLSLVVFSCSYSTGPLLRLIRAQA